MSEPNNCLHCGGEATIIAHAFVFRSAVTCTKCGISTLYYDSEAEAIAAWNRRPPAHEYTVEELREMDGKPVYIVDKVEGDNTGWAIWGDDHIYYWFDNKEAYGKEWLAYDREPEGSEK